MRRGVFYTDEFKEYEIFLQQEAKRLACEISDLELSDADIDYNKIKW